MSDQGFPIKPFDRARQIVCLGVNFRTADLELRGALQVAWSQVEPELRSLGECPGAGWVLREWTLLETCNRFELYAVIEGKPWAFESWFLSRLARHPAVERERLASAFHRWVDFAAHEHLLRVASGLESMVLGETEILGQVKKAQRRAEEWGTGGALLAALFSAAIQTGRRVRNETDISRDRSTVSSLAVAHVDQPGSDLARRRVLVIGLGEMGHITVKALRSHGVEQLAVVNRTAERARSAAERHGFRWWPLEQLDEALAWADVVFACASSSTPLVDRERIGSSDRAGRPLLLVDLAVPRNVAPAVTELPGVDLLALDDLGPAAAKALERRQQSVPAVEAIVAQDLELFTRQLRCLDVEPMIRDLRRRAEEIREAELERVQRLIGELPAETWQTIQGFSRALVNKILHQPTARLRETAVEGDAEGHLQVIRELFDLQESARRETA